MSFQTACRNAKAAMASLKYELIRTPLEEPLKRARELLGLASGLKHPELRELLSEESLIRELTARVLHPRSNCVDAGSHYGSMLSRFVRLAPYGQHLAIEPMPEKAAFLRRRFPEVEVEQVAISDTGGVVPFFCNQTLTGCSGLARHGHGEFDVIEVPAVCLDQLVPDNRRIDFVKLDLEGAELLALRGARSLLARCRPLLLFECTLSGFSTFGHCPADLHHTLTDDYGYAIFTLNGFFRGGAPLSRQAFESSFVYPFRAYNWLALPKA